MNLVYHSKYLDYWEWTRTEFLRSHNLAYKDIETMGYIIPCIDLEIKYLSPAKYDDIIETELYMEIKKSKLIFNYSTTVNTKEIVSGKTTHIFTDNDLRPIRIPKLFSKIFDYE